jgi:ribosomal-protein-alanine N-acetyltransferase
MPGPVFLEGEQLTLHPKEADDADYMAALLSHPEVRRGIGRSDPTTEADAREWIEDSEDTHSFLICVDGDPVGDCSLVVDQPGWDYAELGYAVHPDHWGEGYATEAIDCVARWAFTELGLHKLGADVYETNPASRRVLEKVGFREEGRRRAHAFVQGGYVDLLEFGLLAEEWRDQRGTTE